MKNIIYEFYRDSSIDNLKLFLSNIALSNSLNTIFHIITNKYLLKLSVRLNRDYGDDSSNELFDNELVEEFRSKDLSLNSWIIQYFRIYPITSSTKSSIIFDDSYFKGDEELQKIYSPLHEEKKKKPLFTTYNIYFKTKEELFDTISNVIINLHRYEQLSAFT